MGNFYFAKIFKFADFIQYQADFVQFYDQGS